VKVLVLVPGSRSYECQVQGIADQAKLSSKSLGQLHASGSIQGAPIQSETSFEISHGSEAGEYEVSSAGTSAEAAPAIEDTDIAGIVASDWKHVATFTDQIPFRYPTFDSYAQGMLRVNVPKTPCDFFLAFFPIALVEPCFDSWREHAAEHDRKGLSGLDSRLFMILLALLVRMGLMRLRRREEYFRAGSFAGMSQAVFENLLYTVRDASFPAYEEGQAMPDGRPAFPNDPLKPIRRFADAVLQVWHDMDLQRETEEKARQPEIKLGAIAQTHHTAKLCNAKRSRTRNPKPTHGARDRPKQPQPRAGRDRASESGQQHASRRTRPTGTGTRCPGKGQR
jgi:hypothetical protein